MIKYSVCILCFALFFLLLSSTKAIKTNTLDETTYVNISVSNNQHRFLTLYCSDSILKFADEPSYVGFKLVQDFKNYKLYYSFTYLMDTISGKYNRREIKVDKTRSVLIKKKGKNKVFLFYNYHPVFFNPNNNKLDITKENEIQSILSIGKYLNRDVFKKQNR